MFVRRELNTITESGQHNLAPVAEGPFPVVKISPKTVTIQRKMSTEYISRDPVVVTPVKDTNTDVNKESQTAVEFVMERILDHKPAPFSMSPSLTLYCIQWYSHPPSQNTWELTASIPQHFIRRHVARAEIPTPDDIDVACTLSVANNRNISLREDTYTSKFNDGEVV